MAFVIVSGAAGGGLTSNLTVAWPSTPRERTARFQGLGCCKGGLAQLLASSRRPCPSPRRLRKLLGLTYPDKDVPGAWGTVPVGPPSKPLGKQGHQGLGLYKGPSHRSQLTGPSPELALGTPTFSARDQTLACKIIPCIP